MRRRIRMTMRMVLTLMGASSGYLLSGFSQMLNSATEVPNVISKQIAVLVGSARKEFPI
jgi:hypothetical protein